MYPQYDSLPDRIQRINAHIARYLRDPTPTWLAVQKAVATGMKHLTYYYEPLDHYIHFAQTGLPVHDQHIFDEKAGFFFGVEEEKGGNSGGGGEDGNGRKRKSAHDEEEEEEEEKDGLSPSNKSRKLEGKDDKDESDNESEQPRSKTEGNAGNEASASELKGNPNADAKEKEAGRNIKADPVNIGPTAAQGADSTIGKNYFWTKYDYEEDLYTPFGAVEQCDRTGSKRKACDNEDSTLMAALDTAGEEDKDMDMKRVVIVDRYLSLGKNCK